MRWRPPDVVGSVGAVVDAAEEGVEAGDVIHVQVREAQVVDLSDLGEGHGVQAALAAIEEQATDGLAAVDDHQQGVVAAGVTQHAEGKAHEKAPGSMKRLAPAFYAHGSSL